MVSRFVGKCLFCGCVALWLMFLLCTTATPAYAYIDPGSGLFLMQMVGSTFAGIAFILRKRVRDFFRRFSRHSD
jgi:hypothetical protein